MAKEPSLRARAEGEAGSNPGATRRCLDCFGAKLLAMTANARAIAAATAVSLIALRAGGPAAFFHIGDLGLQIAIAHGADDDFIADHKGRRSIDLQRLGKLFGLLDSCCDCRICGILLESVDVGAKLLGERKRFRFACMAARAQKLLVKLPKFSARIL